MSLEPESAGWSWVDKDWRDKMHARAEESMRRTLADRAARGVERTSAARVPLTLDTLIDAIGQRVDDGCGWDLLKRQQYAAHLVQSYCECEVDNGWRDDPGGWALCAHAVDEGF